ncbi:GntR family transcriptional regulator [Lacihabitans sp. CS3-21]|jgi:GntR family transcriptional regulator|uniref:GntR family transcriptional regulator n=1 Tax=Lacihabitans sp. CS3-21 TaxID=2487332 RepID=UPI0020CCA29E|nr:GntR family transcriptional regulator [Lacihabitans sp. CS3-21]MCP9747980.1 GntR family transcriptional regulator [Lacihabitans sp. CS3-21]
MNFKDKQAIYLQIAGYVLEQILLGEIPIGSKMPSIRDLAVQIEVNPNTVQRTYDFLQQKEIISTKRGIGYFVNDDAREKIIEFKKEQFISDELPNVFRSLHLLDIDFDELKKRYLTYIENNF